MSRYNSNYVLVYASQYCDVLAILKEDIFQSYLDIFTLKSNGLFLEICVTQLGGIEYVSDILRSKYPNLLFLEKRYGESGYNLEFLTKGSSRKNLDIHFELIPRGCYSQINEYFEKIKQ